MALSQHERELAAIATGVDSFVDTVGRFLFQEERYDDLNLALLAFYQANNAGTAVWACRKFYRGRLPALIANFHLTKFMPAEHWDQVLHQFPSLIAHAVPTREAETQTNGYDISEYLALRSQENLRIATILKELVEVYHLYAEQNDIQLL
jgi:hypothetical protein